jgi:hypothetical protein
MAPDFILVLIILVIEESLPKVVGHPLLIKLHID